MAEQDLLVFLNKVQQLQELVKSLDRDPQRRQTLAECSDHNAVVSLARDWGFEIGRRWGETKAAPNRQDNLLREPIPRVGQETERQLLEGNGWRLTLIHSNGSRTPDGVWMDQEEAEWVLLLRGSARLICLDPEETMDLSVGDPVLIPAHRPHRVERTDPAPGTLWLALHWRV